LLVAVDYLALHIKTVADPVLMVTTQVSMELSHLAAVVVQVETAATRCFSVPDLTVALVVVAIQKDYRMVLAPLMRRVYADVQRTAGPPLEILAQERAAVHQAAAQVPHPEPERLLLVSRR
jgi:hypothetical protein